MFVFFGGGITNKYRKIFSFHNKNLFIQWNLSIADTLYSGHLVIADTFSRNWTNHGQTLIEKPLYSGHFYSGHLVIADTFFWNRVDISYISYLSIADTLIFLGKNKISTKEIIYFLNMYSHA